MGIKRKPREKKIKDDSNNKQGSSKKYKRKEKRRKEIKNEEVVEEMIVEEVEHAQKNNHGQVNHFFNIENEQSKYETTTTENESQKLTLKMMILPSFLP